MTSKEKEKRRANFRIDTEVMDLIKRRYTLKEINECIKLTNNCYAQPNKEAILMIILEAREKVKK